jgi:tetratricopeptide (TPR) repeat protein
VTVEALIRVGRGEEARTVAVTALAEARARGRRRAQVTFLRALATVAVDHATGDATTYLEEALEIARDLHDGEAEGGILSTLGNVAYEAGSLDEAELWYRAAIAVLRPSGARHQLCIALGNLARTLSEQAGREGEAHAAGLDAFEIARQLGNRRLEGVWLGNLAMDDFAAGRLDDAATRTREGIELVRSVGERRVEGIFLNNLASIALARGDPAGAERHIAAALEIHREIRSPRMQGEALGIRGLVELRSGRPDAALESCREGEVLLRGLGDQYLLGKLLCARAEVERARGDADAAAATWMEADAIARALRVGPTTDFGQALRAAAPPT